MIPAKEESIRLIQKLPDESTLADIIATLYFKQTVERGLEDIEAGRILTHKEVKERMAQWAKSIGH
jgi:predicted transcriptional regulator